MTREGVEHPSARQAAICTRAGAAPLVPGPMQKLGVALATLGLRPLHGLRHPPEAGDAGWYVWGGELSERADFFQPLHAAHAKRELPLVVDYLALPPGWRFVVHPEESYEDLWFDESLLD